MRRIAHCVALALASACAGVSRPAAGFDRADSVLVHRILEAENRRDAADPAINAGERHPDARIRNLARRAWSRTTDSLFARRDSFPSLAAPPHWPEPAWRVRLRTLAGRDVACSAIRVALADSAWPVRLAAADAVLRTGAANTAPVPCATDTAIVDTLLAWVGGGISNSSRRPQGGVSWHPAAHAMVALAYLGAPAAADMVRRFARHDNAHLRRYAVRAADVRDDLPTLRQLARDTDPNVREAAIEVIRKTTAQRDDSLFIAALTSEHAQVVRAAAAALAGSTNPAARAAAAAVFDRWVGRAVASERDVREALLIAAGRPVTDDRPPARRAPVPPLAVSLAMGADVRLRVQMASSGGGTFVVRMRGDVAPITAARIVEAALRGDYDGLTWHRVEHDFVIQGGSPGASEYVGSAEYFRDELGPVPHRRGTVGMSTRGHDTGDAQWFINLKDNLRLGRDYTVFAEVISGIDVVDAVVEADTIARIERVRD